MDNSATALLLLLNLKISNKYSIQFSCHSEPSMAQQFESKNYETLLTERRFSAFQTVATVAPNCSPKLFCNVKNPASADQVVLIATDTEIGIRLSGDDIDVEAPRKRLFYLFPSLVISCGEYG